MPHQYTPKPLETMPRPKKSQDREYGGLFTSAQPTLSDSEADTVFPGDDAFYPYSEDEFLSEGYSGDSEWENLPPATTERERLAKKKADVRGAWAEAILMGRTVRMEGRETLTKSEGLQKGLSVRRRPRRGKHWQAESLQKPLFRRTDHYASIYCLGATGLLAKYAVKKYTSHRTVSAQDITKAWQEQARHNSMLKGKYRHIL
jgi:hypothetical protein